MTINELINKLKKYHNKYATLLNVDQYGNIYTDDLLNDIDIDSLPDKLKTIQKNITFNTFTCPYCGKTNIYFSHLDVYQNPIYICRDCDEFINVDQFV